jgi:biopolymer transport protein ExbD
MPAIKAKRQSVSLDMTAMCDVAFLLLTFFMLTAKFKPEEAVTITPPSSISEKPLPGDKNIITISVSPEGQVFLATDKTIRSGMLDKMLTKYGISLTDAEKTHFLKSEVFGYPMGALKRAVNMETAELKASGLQTGIPCDSAKNELFLWVNYARIVDPTLKVAIKGDSEAQYKVFSQVVGTLQEQNVNVFQLITGPENKPKGL